MIQFDLPEELIAQSPAHPRDHARLLIYNRATKTIVDDYFYNLANYLSAETRLVVNNSKVSHCRYLFDGGKTEIFAIESVNDRTVRALVRPGRKFRLGETRQLTESVNVEVTTIDKEGIRTIVFDQRLDHRDLQRARHVPLPPYIKQDDALADEYQTIYAKREGSLAAPTAGLHFTTELKDSLQSQFGWSELTLEVGLGTFAPLSEENFQRGTLHSEHYIVSPETYREIVDAPHITAVGTTSVRTIETVFSSDEPVLSGDTAIFIQPGFHFRRVNSMVTNFHLPGTSLLLLVEAFVGNEKELARIYAHAIAERYRFYSFGDAMLIQ